MSEKKQLDLDDVLDAKRRADEVFERALHQVKKSRASGRAAEGRESTSSVRTKKNRQHGTINEPYMRDDLTQTRQTTLTIPMDLDLQMQSFFLRHRSKYRNKADLWNTAMRYFLLHHEVEGTS